MKKILLPIILLLILFPTIVAAKTTTVNLSVPFTSEIPNGKWVKPWNNACEEAVIVMIEQYYLGNKKSYLTKTEAIKLMSPLFPIEQKLFGYDSDTTIEENNTIINDYTGFGSYIKNDPTIAEIKNELASGRPVITAHYGYDLHNPNIPWRRGGSYYHVMTIVGYDDAAQKFITNDPGNHATGLDYRYKYAIIMGSLHDFDHATKTADGPARVLFTTPKLAKIAGDPTVYLLKDGVKHRLASSGILKPHGWSWKMLKTVDSAWLDSFPTGDIQN
ncbi:MAG: hypothetical protein A2261_01560 [Candidatus Magasanikbacteria bacterium RIFOXYA2_FULL_44_8]|uniref:Peptidase C39-like domain-containing protein n=1 Tax=Candidatus Magasanikbacteria bacterium RIFOXYA2_FULL_44_8 TaxID=1798696 RepID=A0A1F6NKE7_9BACT|nr:MAG: hypothetical protein A2261_01560 [Candidatus Magasanikbacteria bacterium RIFOXYA2_FULL_44_8]